MLLNNEDRFIYLMRAMIFSPDTAGKKILAELLGIFEQMPPIFQQITEAIQDVYSKPVKISGKLVWDYCNSRGWFDLHGWIKNIISNDATFQWQYHLDFVLNEAKRERIIHAIQSIDLTSETDELIKALGELSKLSKYDQSYFSDLDEVAESIFKGEKLKRIPSGLRGLDHALDGGFPIGDVSVIAGSTGSGKSALAYFLALNALKSGNAQVSIYSLEMTARDVFARMASMDSGINQKFLGGCDQSKKSINYLKSQYHAGNLRIRANTTNLAQIRNQAIVDSKWGEKPQMIIVDYTGLVDHKSKSTYEKMSEISIALRQIALDAKCAMIEVVQLNREYKKAYDTHTEARPPILTDLRDSGQIEQDASVILMLHTPKTESLVDSPWKPRELYLRKNRHGQNELIFDLEFNGSAYQFKERF